MKTATVSEKKLTRIPGGCGSRSIDQRSLEDTLRNFIPKYLQKLRNETLQDADDYNDDEEYDVTWMLTTPMWSPQLWMDGLMMTSE